MEKSPTFICACLLYLNLDQSPITEQEQANVCIRYLSFNDSLKSYLWIPLTRLLKYLKHHPTNGLMSKNNNTRNNCLAFCPHIFSILHSIRTNSGNKIGMHALWVHCEPKTKIQMADELLHHAWQEGVPNPPPQITVCNKKNTYSLLTMGW